MVKAHANPTLCPIQTFLAYRDRRPTCTVSTLFINSLQSNNDISVRTIQSWISKLLRMSTTEYRVSLRSIASSLALQSGIPKEDVVTVGNWSSSATFEHQYRREHLSQFDFTNVLITEPEEDIFFDAVDTLD